MSCGDEDASGRSVWPRQFVSFAFGSDVVVVYPATCRTIDFNYDTNPPTSIDELELSIDEGSMTAHTVEPLAPNASANARGEGRGVWRICAGDDAPLDGSIRVTFRDHPEYYAETRLVQREYLEEYADVGPRLVLPTQATYPTDLRFSDDGSRIEVATGEGLILHFDAQSGVLLRSENIPGGGVTFFDETRVMNDENDWNRQRFLDRANRYVLSSVGLYDFSDMSGTPGDLVYGHGQGRTLAIAGSVTVGDGYGPAMIATYDLDGREATLHEYRWPVTYRVDPNRSHFPHLVVAPSGRRIAWSGLGAPAETDYPDTTNEILNLDTGESCSFGGNTILRGEIQPINIAIPSFSADSAWLAHWATQYGPRDYDDHPIVVYDATTCRRRAYSEDLPPNFHRGAVAVARGGDLVAATSEAEVVIYDAPAGPDAEMTVRARVPSAPTKMLNADTQASDFSDRLLLKRFRYRYPVLRFSSDGSRLVSASNAAVRIIDVSAPEVAVETPAIDTTDYAVFGDYLRVGVMNDDGRDLIYGVWATSTSFVYRLADGEEFVGIDQYGVLISRVGGRYVRRDLRAQTTEDAGETEPAWTPSFGPALTVAVTARGIEVTR